MKARYWVPVVALTAAVTAGAWAAPAREAEAPRPGAAEETLSAAEDIAVVKALAPLQLTRSQLSQLLPVLQSAQEKLAELDRTEQARLTSQSAALEQARRDLLSGKGTAVRAQEQFDLARTTSAQRRAGLRTEMVASIRRA